MPLEAQLFRPRGALAASLLVGPMLLLLAALALAGISGVGSLFARVVLAVGGGLAALWLVAALGLARILLTTVRASSEGIEARTPWDSRRLLRWALIDRVERRFGILRLHSSDGQQLIFIEIGLTQSRQLLRQILLRVSPAVLSSALKEALALLGGPADPNAEYTVAVAPIWIAGASATLAGGIALAVWGHFAGGMPLFITGIGLAALSAGMLVLFRQTVAITETGMALARGFGKPTTLAWDDVGVMDKVPLDFALALRSGERRLIILGPFFFAPLRAEIFRSTISVHVLDRGVPVYEAWRIW